MNQATEKNLSKTVLLIDPCQYTLNYNNCMLDGMVKNDARIIYLTSPHEDSPTPKGVKKIHCFFFLARILAKIIKSNSVRRVLRALEYPFNLIFVFIFALCRRIKVVHFMWTIVPWLDYWFIKLFHFFGIKVVYTAHNPFPHDFDDSCIKYYSRIYSIVDRIIVLTEYSKNTIIQKTGVDANQFVIVPHGEFDYVMQHVGFNNDLYERLSDKLEGKKVVTFLGMIRPYKGVEYLINAIPNVIAKRSDVFFIIAGSTRFADTELLEKMILDVGGEGVCYHDFRYIPTSDFKVYLKLTDVLVQPYISASQSGNTAMAYSAGIPVVSTNVGGLPEMIESGKTGFVVKPKDSEAISDAILKILHEDRYYQMKEACKEAAVQKYDWIKLSKQILDVYGTV